MKEDANQLINHESIRLSYTLYIIIQVLYIVVFLLSLSPTSKECLFPRPQ